MSGAVLLGTESPTPGDVLRHPGRVTSPLPPTFTAQTPEQARLLLDLAYAPALAVLIDREASAGEVGQASGNTVKQAHHRLTRMVGAGLVEVVGERKRGGRPVKLYRAVSAAYRVPFALTTSATVEDWLEAMHRPFLESYRRAVADAYRSDTAHALQIELDERRFLHMRLEPRLNLTDHHRGYGTVRTATLKPGAVQELKQRLQDLSAWVTAQEAGEDPGAAPCILALLFTPGRVEGS